MIQQPIKPTKPSKTPPITILLIALLLPLCGVMKAQGGTDYGVDTLSTLWSSDPAVMRCFYNQSAIAVSSANGYIATYWFGTQANGSDLRPVGASVFYDTVNQAHWGESAANSAQYSGFLYWNMTPNNLGIFLAPNTTYYYAIRIFNSQEAVDLFAANPNALSQIPWDASTIEQAWARALADWQSGAGNLQIGDFLYEGTTTNTGAVAPITDYENCTFFLTQTEDGRYELRVWPGLNRLLASDIINMVVGRNDLFTNSLNQLGNPRARLDWTSPIVRGWSAWSRAYALQRNYHLQIEGVSRMRALFYGVAIGADRVWNLNNDNKLIAGVFGAYDGSHFNFRRNDGSRSKGSGLGGGVYASWSERDGWFADALVKASALRENLRSFGTRATFNNNGIGAMIAAGKHFTRGDYWVFEPAVNITYAHLAGCNNALVSVGCTDVFQYRAGLTFGRHVNNVELFGRIGALRQKSSGARITDNVNVWTANSDGCRAELALGLNWRINDRSHFDIAYHTSFGAGYTQPWGVNLGLNYKF